MYEIPLKPSQGPFEPEEGFTCSGIVVTVRPGELGSVQGFLERLDGIRVHQVDQESCRIVVTQVAFSDDLQAEGLRRIQRVEGVLAASLVYYHRGDPEDAGDPREEREQNDG